MYNCLKFCRRFFNPFTLEAVNQLSRLNGKQLSNGRSIPKYLSSFNSTLSETRKLQKENVSNFDELVSYIQTTQRVQIDQISKLFAAIKDANLTEEQVLSLLECCSNSVPNGNSKTKHDLCENILKRYQKCGRFSEKVYSGYINICTQNRQCLDVETFISIIGSNMTSNLLRLMLCNVCECGETDKARTVLEEMKKRRYSLDEEIFNHLALCHTIKGGLSSGLKIVQTMNTAKIKESSDTLFFIIRGLAQTNNKKEFTEALERYKISYSEDKILSLLESLGLSGNHTWANTVTKLVDKSSLSRYFSTELEQLCKKLVHNRKYDAAFEIYKLFEDAKSNLVSPYGGFILEEMLLCSAPVEKIVQFAQDLKKSGLNEYALENVTGVALRNEMYVTALNLLSHFSVLRPHYFWPILVEVHAREGEIGLMGIVQTASEMGVTFDSESFHRFVFPRCDLRNPQRVLKLFQDLGYTVRSLLTPLIISLLAEKDLFSVLQLCETYKDVKIDPEDIVTILSVTWFNTNNHEDCLTLLQRVSESQSEIFLGKFLIDILLKMRNKRKMTSFLELLKEFKKRNLRISSVTADSLMAIINRDPHLNENVDEINSAINDIIDFSKIPTVQVFTHPRDMSISQLELHLIELKSKGMETRGVLRRLIQRYAGRGNPQRVRELREELASRGYNSSPGIKSAVMHSHVQEGDLKEALEIYEELKETAPNFRMDAFKIIDLARLLVKRDMFDKAVELLLSSGKQNGTEAFRKSLHKNCLFLLRSILDIDQQNKIFNILVEYGYCDPSNIILGAIMQLHLDKDTLENTVDLYVDICHKYDKTPMQVVLLSKLLEAGKDELLQRVLDASAFVHGNTSARCSLVAAMCERGLVKQVVTVLQGCDINPTIDLEKRCERWVQTNSLAPLQTLLAASKELPLKIVNVPKIKLSIMQLYSKRNDCDGALAFWKKLVDEDDHVDTEVDNEFCELLNRCKFDSEHNLSMKYKLK